MAEPKLQIERQIAQLVDEQEKMMRRIAREEIASLCGLVLRRASSTDQLSSIFAEALNDFSGQTEGSEPGPDEVG